MGKRKPADGTKQALMPLEPLEQYSFEMCSRYIKFICGKLIEAKFSREEMGPWLAVLRSFEDTFDQLGAWTLVWGNLNLVFADNTKSEDPIIKALVEEVWRLVKEYPPPTVAGKIK